MTTRAEDGCREDSRPPISIVEDSQVTLKPATLLASR